MIFIVLVDLFTLAVQFVFGTSKQGYNIGVFGYVRFGHVAQYLVSCQDVWLIS